MTPGVSRPKAQGRDDDGGRWPPCPRPARGGATRRHCSSRSGLSGRIQQDRSSKQWRSLRPRAAPFHVASSRGYRLRLPATRAPVPPSPGGVDRPVCSHLGEGSGRQNARWPIPIETVLDIPRPHLVKLRADFDDPRLGFRHRARRSEDNHGECRPGGWRALLGRGCGCRQRPCAGRKRLWPQDLP